MLTDTLELENLDFNEFEAGLDSLRLRSRSLLSALAPYGSSLRMGIFDRLSTMSSRTSMI